MPRVTEESLDIRVLLEQQVCQDWMAPLVPQGTVEHQVLDMQDYVVPKVTLVLLDPKGIQGLLAPQVLVSQGLRGYLDLKVIRDILAYQEFLDDKALQVSHAVMKMGLDYLVLRVNQVHQGFQVTQEEMVLWEIQDTQARKA